MNRIIFAANAALFIVLLSQVTTERTRVDSNSTSYRPLEIQPRSLSAEPIPRRAPEIQVNRLPHPLNVNGMLPYQVWVDGKRVKLNSPEAKTIIKALDLNFTQPVSTPEIHAGAGWLHPFELQ